MRGGLILAVSVVVLASPVRAHQALNGLLKSLQNESGERRIEAIRQLGHLKDPKAVGPLLSLFDVRGGEPKLSLAIVRALGEIGEPSTEQTLTQAWDYLNSVRLEYGEELPPNVVVLREALAESLGEVGGDRAREVLLQSISDDDSAVVENSIRGLGRLREKRAIEPLLALISRRGPVGQAAFEALAEIGDHRSAERLEAALKTDDPTIQAEAAYALALCRNEPTDKMALSTLMLNEKLETQARVLAAYYLVKLDRNIGFEFLEKLLHSRSADDQAAAAQALGKSGNPRAVAPLAEAIKKADGGLKLAIIPNLAFLGGPKAVSALKRLEEDKLLAVHQAAQMTLTQMGEEQ